MPQVLLGYLRQYTTEGDTNVLFLQTTRFLMAAWRSASAGGASPGRHCHFDQK
jgi:hypothetical protein